MIDLEVPVQDHLEKFEKEAAPRLFRHATNHQAVLFLPRPLTLLLVPLHLMPVLILHMKSDSKKIEILNSIKKLLYILLPTKAISC